MFCWGCSMIYSWAVLLDLVDLRVLSLSVAALDTAYNSDNDADAAKDWPHDDQDDDGDSETNCVAGSFSVADAYTTLGKSRIGTVTVTWAGGCSAWTTLAKWWACSAIRSNGRSAAVRKSSCASLNATGSLASGECAENGSNDRENCRFHFIF